MKLKKIQILVLLIIPFYIGKAQNPALNILKKLDFSQEQLEALDVLYSNNQFDDSMEELLKLYREKDNLYLKIDSNDEFIKKTFSEEIGKSIEIADQVRNNYFLFRYDWDMEKTNIPYQFNREIDWTFIPNGDEEWCFMLNRHRFWIDLGRAYFITGQEKYAKTFVNQVEHWIDNNPLDNDLKKMSWRRIEAGIRCENWIKAFEYVKNSKYITSDFLAKFISTLIKHGEYINSSFNNFSKTSNWGVLEYQGLFNLSQFLKEFKFAKQWEIESLKKLTTCINLQVLPDGGHWEQSPMYHNEVFHCFLNINYIAQQNNLKLSDDIIQKTKKMAFANVIWQKPNYHQPLLGDSDDTDTRGLLTFASYLFSDQVLKSRAFTKVDYENYFLLGKEGMIKYNEMISEKPNFASRYMESLGDFYMRSSWEEDANYLSIHLKKMGAGHGHDNLLHFTLFSKGKDYLVDSGRYSYVDDQWRELFKSNKSHNTLGVDNLTNSIYSDSWTNSFEARSEGVFTKSNELYDYAEAENTAYKRLKDPVSVKRRVISLKSHVWLFFDSFSSNKQHRYSQYFNFPNDSIKKQNDGLETTYNKNNLIIKSIKKSDIVLSNAWYSPEYNLKIKSKRAELYKDYNGFYNFITLLYLPDETHVTFKKELVYNRNNVLLSDSDVEGVTLFINNTSYTILVVHNSPAPAVQFFKINNQLVSGEVVLIENDKNRIHVIK